MSFIGKSFNHEKDENLKDFLVGIGVPSDKVEGLASIKPTHTYAKDGDNYSILIKSVLGDKELKFQSGVEFDEDITEGIVAKTTITVEDDVITQVQKFSDDRILTIKREFSDNQLVETLTGSSWDGTARRFFTVAN